MPRRRATKIGSRAKPKLPAGDEGAQLAKETRRDKLEALLKDFDMEVENRLLQMEREAKSMCRAIMRATNMELFKMPQNIKKMTVEQFFSTGGSFNQKALEDYSQQVESLASSITSNKPKPESTVPDASQLETEENETAPKATKTTKRGRPKKADTTTTKKTTRPTRRRGASKTASDTDDENATPGPSRTRTSTRAARQTRRATAKSQFETPATNTGSAGLINAGLSTPMVTPKFDPRLPLTPAVMREAKRGETIISMSGSPINNPSRLNCEKPGLLTLGNGKVIDMHSEAEMIENLAMDETTRKNIMMLQQNLTKILQHSTKNT